MRGSERKPKRKRRGENETNSPPHDIYSPFRRGSRGKGLGIPRSRVFKNKRQGEPHEEGERGGNVAGCCAITTVMMKMPTSSNQPYYSAAQLI